MKHSDSIIGFFDEVLNEKKCFDLARHHKFIERSTSKLRGYEFIKALIIPNEGLSTDSLKGLCIRIREFNPDAEISSQALCERINDISSKELMKSVYTTILSYMHSQISNNSSELKVLEKFNSVLIEDSTVAKLDEKLQQDFQGTNRGGTGAKSQVKIDLIYDVMKGKIVSAEIYNGKEPDQSLAGRIVLFAKAGDLVIRDLGYFVLRVFKILMESGVFFISRLPPHVKIFLNKNDAAPIDLGRYLKKHYRKQIVIDMPQVFLGDEKIPSRLVLYKLPKDIVEAKLREANKRARETGRQMSHGKRLFLQYTAFVTNTSKELISTSVVGSIYRLRWEIELIFKRWKSQLKIDYLKGINKNRIECLIWSRLSSVLIIEIINGHVTRLAHKIFSNFEISHAKVINYILRQSKFCKVIVQNRLEEFLEEMQKDIRRMLLKDKRRRKTMRERVITFENYYEMQPSDIQRVA